jgi:hypothetical protein
VVPGEPVAESVRKSQDSFPHRQAAQDLVGKVPCQFRHAPFAARRTEVTALAREGDEDLAPAVVAAEAGEAARQGGAGNELAELPLDELGEPSPAALVSSRKVSRRSRRTLCRTPSSRLLGS